MMWAVGTWKQATWAVGTWEGDDQGGAGDGPKYVIAPVTVGRLMMR